MPTNVEENVVSMKFDNAGFAEKIGGTLTLLQRLREKLSFKGAEQGFQQIDAAQKNVKFDAMAAGIDSISQKFSAMGAIAFSVLNNLVNRVVDAGLRMAKALSLGPLTEGFQEYETNMGSIQTILANTKSKGSTLEDVNAALQELNEYSDKTIYNFSEMAKNIGTFTSAGVDLDSSVAAIKGFSNVSAIAGVDATRTAGAMYQLSQAMSAGEVRLMDWRSIEQAGMGGEIFKKALFESGKAMGKINFAGTFEEWEKSVGSFRTTLEDGWLTTDVMTQTLAAFTGDLSEAQLVSMGYTEQQAKEMAELGRLGVASATEVKTITQLFSTIKESIATGWSDSFRIIIGDFEEAKSLLTSINNAVSGFVGRWSEARNDLLRGWKFLGGRDALINGLKEALAGLAETFRTIGGAWRDVFPKMDGWKLLELTNGFTKFVKSLIPTQEQLVHIRSIFQGVFSVLAIGWEVVKNVASAFKQIVSAFGSNGGGDILWFFSDLGMQLKSVKEELVDNGGIKNFFDKVVPKIANVISKINLEPIFEGIKTAFQVVVGVIDGIALFIEKLNLPELFGKIGEALNNIKAGFEDFLGGGETLDATSQKLADRWAWLGDVGEKLGNALIWVADKAAALTGEIKNLMSSFAETLKTGNFDYITDALNVGILGAMALGFKKFFDKLSNFTGDGFMEKIDSVLEGLTDTLGAMQAQLKSEALLNIAKAVGVLAASLLVMSLIDSDDLAKALAATAAGFAQLAATMAVLAKIEMGPRGALKVNAMASALIGLGAALLVFALAAKIMSTMDTEELMRGLGGVAFLLTGVVVALKNMPEVDGMISTGLGVMAIAAALLLLTIPVKILGGMDVERMIQGLIGVGLLLTGITVAVKNMPDAKGMFGTGLGIIAIALALLVLVAPVKLLGDMPVERMIQGFIGVGLLLAAITIAVNSMPASNMLGIGAGLLLIAVGLGALVAAVFILGNMDINSLLIGLVAIAGLLLIIAVAANAMTGAALGAAAILVVSAALVVLGLALKIIASIGAGGLILAIIAIAGVLLLLAVSASALTPLIPGMIALGLAMVAFGLGLALVGASIFLVGAGLFMIVRAIQALADLALDSMDGLVALFDLIIRKSVELGEAIFTMVLDLANRFIQALPEIIKGIGEAFGTLIQVLRERMPEFFLFLNELITNVLLLIRDKAPDFIETALFLIESLLKGIRDHAEMITNAAVDLILTFARTMKSRIQELVNAGGELIIAFLEGLNQKVPDIAFAAAVLIVTVIQAMADMHQAMIDAGIDLIVQLLTGIGDKAQDVIDAGKDFVLKILEGIGDAATEILSAVTNLVVTILLGIAANYQKLIDGGGEMLLKILEGTTNKITEIGNAASRIVIDFMHEIADSIRENSEGFREAGLDIASAIVSGLTGGLSDKLGVVVDGGKDMASGFIEAVTNRFDINSPSKVMIGVGNSVVEGLATGIGQNRSVLQEAGLLGDHVTKALQNSLSGVSASVESLGEFQPKITPVLDLSNVKAGAKNLGDMFNQQDLLAGTSFMHASLISKENESSSSTPEETAAAPKEISFTQVINSPKELRTGDIYRQTRSQLVIAKEKLG